MLWISCSLPLMQPLARQPSRTSLLSWWSDSNPPGATISIHAVAKPLMRFMYYRQALDYIKSYQGFEFTSPMLEIYSSYLFCKYVSPATKALVLSELRVRSREENACAVILGDESLLHQLVELAGSADVAINVGVEACRLLGDVAVSPATPHSKRVALCVSLVSLLRDKDDEIIAAATETLSYATSSFEVADAVIDAKAQDYFSELLKVYSSRKQ
ncbi:hypothetical protein B0H11DRAFT_1009354 [Mycena galericulata]|nr:hypothetical protein B0H11DRAFT_2065974 [Mycena galericulata]KAJ7491467.1 hypothetical protein B0H11DRAFT_1009354 [Mycena galericulata]